MSWFLPSQLHLHCLGTWAWICSTSVWRYRGAGLTYDRGETDVVPFIWVNDVRRKWELRFYCKGEDAAKWKGGQT